jgi:hypothetical protein
MATNRSWRRGFTTRLSAVFAPRLAIRICGLDDLSRRATSHENGNEARADTSPAPAGDWVWAHFLCNTPQSAARRR